MTNYLELEGQFHTSVSLNSITQQTLYRVSNDSRFQVIHKSLTTYDKIMNAILYHIVSIYYFSPKSVNVTRNTSVSIPGNFDSTSKTAASLKSIRTSPRLIARTVSAKKPLSVSVKLLIPNKSAKIITRNSSSRSTKSARSKTPLLGKVESYDKVMKRLAK
jgi:hypothetical protein